MLLHSENITIGSCFSQQELDCISRKSQTGRAIEKAYNLLSFRMHSQKELYDKLMKTFDEDCSRKAVEKMRLQGFVDDEKFALMKAEYLFKVKKSSLFAVQMKLQSLGIDKAIINNVLLSFDIEDQQQDIIQLLQTKYSQKLAYPQKVAASLMRKGFKYNDIRKAFESLEIDIQEY